MTPILLILTGLVIGVLLSAMFGPAYPPDDEC